MTFGKLIGLIHHTHAALGRRREHHLCAQEPHQPAALDAEAFGHRHDERVALLRTDHRQADAGVAAGCLDDGLTGFEFAGALGVLDHAERQTILDRTEWIECLNFDEQVDPGGRKPVYPDNGSVADRLQNVGISMSHIVLLDGFRVQASSRCALHPM